MRPEAAAAGAGAGAFWGKATAETRRGARQDAERAGLTEPPRREADTRMTEATAIDAGGMDDTGERGRLGDGKVGTWNDFSRASIT